MIERRSYPSRRLKNGPVLVRAWLSSSRTPLVFAGLICWLGAVLSYARSGPADAVTLIFIAGVLAIAFAFPGAEESDQTWKLHIAWGDIALGGLIVLAFAPVYLVDIYETPWQVNTDEITIAITAERIANASPSDPFGLSFYFGFPNLPFLVYGKAAQLLGGIDLANMRIIHALGALAAIAASFALFRQLLPRLTAAVATVILAANHSLLGISRMAMRDNSGLLIEEIALAVLFFGLSRRSLRATFLGGVLAGVSFYTYYPGRATIVLWVLFLAGAIFLLLRDRNLTPIALRHGAVALFAFILTITPGVIATLQYEDSAAIRFQKEQVLLFPEGRQLQVAWTGGTDVSEFEAIKVNVLKGLKTFNARIGDHGNIYPNRGHGFVDPLTGVLLWIGVAVAIYRLLRVPDRRSGDLLALIGFSFLYLTSAFFVTKAPNYTRLLVILPFVAYLAATGVETLATFAAATFQRLTRRSFSALSMVALVVLTGAIATWNLAIFQDFATKGRDEGNDVGSTGRYAAARNHIDGYAFYVVADQEHPYYGWGQEYQWRDWLAFFVPDDQKVEVIPPAQLGPANLQAPFTLFTSRAVWRDAGGGIEARFPGLAVTNMTADGRLLAIEVR